MLRSIRGRLIVAVVVMAVLLGALIYFQSMRLSQLDETLTDLGELQQFKSHVLIPQKDMNQFIAAMDNTVLLLELGEVERAQESYDESVDAEQDISAEFAFLEENGSDELLALAEQTHQKWEAATEYMKIRAETVAAELGITLVRPPTEPLKVEDEHTAAGAENARSQYGQMGAAELEALMEDDATNPLEIADVDVDALEEATDEVLAQEEAAGDSTLTAASRTVIFGSAGVLVAILVIGALVTTSVSRPLGQLKKGAEEIAEGNLDYRFDDVPADEVGVVIQTVETMSTSLKARIRTLEEVAGLVVITSEDIRTAAETLQPDGTAVDTIVKKSNELKGLVGQVLKGD